MLSVLACLLAGGAGPRAVAGPRAGLKVEGRHRIVKRKEGKRVRPYHMVGVDEAFEFSVGGPRSVVLLTRGTTDGAVSLHLELDDRQEAVIEAQLARRASRAVFIRIPAGRHRVVMAASEKVLVRPRFVRRSTRRADLLVRWRDKPEPVPVVPLTPSPGPSRVAARPVVRPPDVRTAPAASSKLPSVVPARAEARRTGGIRTPVGGGAVVAPRAGLPAADGGSVAGDAAPARVWRLRIAPKVGGVVPRTDFGITTGFGLALEVGLDPALDGLGLYVEVGYMLLKQQGQDIVPGRGLTQVIQNSHVVPMEVGLAMRIGDADWPVIPRLSAGVVLDVVKTSLEAFSSSQTNSTDLAPGVAVGAGALIPAGPGAFFIELRHREAWADLGGLGVETLGAFSFWGGYQFDVGF